MATICSTLASCPARSRFTVDTESPDSDSICSTDISRSFISSFKDSPNPTPEIVLRIANAHWTSSANAPTAANPCSAVFCGNWRQTELALTVSTLVSVFLCTSDATSVHPLPYCKYKQKRPELLRLSDLLQVHYPSFSGLCIYKDSDCEVRLNWNSSPILEWAYLSPYIIHKSSYFRVLYLECFYNPVKVLPIFWLSFQISANAGKACYIKHFQHFAFRKIPRISWHFGASLGVEK